MKAPAARADRDALSVAQLNAVDLLAAGRNDTETAAALGVSRVSVTRWRQYAPAFQAALAERRGPSGASPPTASGPSSPWPWTPSPTP